MRSAIDNILIIIKIDYVSAIFDSFILRRSSFSRIAVMSFFIDSTVGLSMFGLTLNCIGSKLLMSPFTKVANSLYLFNFL